MKRTFLSISLFILTLPLMAVNTELIRTAVGYKLALNGYEHDVNNYDVDSRLKFLDQNKLTRLGQVGCLKARQMSNGDYRVEVGGGLNGGGPVTASVLYWTTKVLCYGTATAATGAIVVGTGGVAAGAAGTAAAAAATGTAAAAGTATVAGVSAATGAGIAAGGIAAGVGANAAATATMATVTSAGGAAGAVAAVESASMGAAAIGLWLPLP